MASKYFHINSRLENSGELQRFLFGLGAEWTTSGRTIITRRHPGIIVGNLNEAHRNKILMYGGTPSSAYMRIEWEDEGSKEIIAMEYKKLYRELKGKKKPNPGERVRVKRPGALSYTRLS